MLQMETTQNENSSTYHGDATSSIDIGSSPTKPSLEDLPEPTATPVSSLPPPLRVGNWVMPDVPERQNEPKVDIDPNGDDDLVASQVMDILQTPRTPHPVAQNAPSPHLSRSLSSASTPLTRRARRTVPVKDPVARSPAPQEDLSELIKDALTNVDSILASVRNDTSQERLFRLVTSSPLVPGFLQPEIVKFLQRHLAESQSHSNMGSDSDTQDDGFLRTKKAWILELCKILDDRALGGADMFLEASKDAVTVVLILNTDPAEIEIRKCDQDQIMQWRSQVATNPWFDAHGQPFAVSYSIIPQSLDSVPSLLTQPSSAESLQKDLASAIKERDRMSDDLEAALASQRSSQEQSDLLRQLYDDAIKSVSETQNEIESLRQANEDLQRQVTSGLEAAREFSRVQVDRLTDKVTATEAQLSHLLNQNALMNDELRRKAACWDVHEARLEQEKRLREKEEKERQAKRAQLQATLFGKKPHEYLLEVDLEGQRSHIPLQRDAPLDSSTVPIGAEDDDDDELAALQQEAAAHGDVSDAINLQAPRSRRSQRTSARPLIDNPSPRQRPAMQEGAHEVAETIAEQEWQAQSAAADGLEDEFAFRTASLASDQNDVGPGGE